MFGFNKPKKDKERTEPGYRLDFRDSAINDDYLRLAKEKLSNLEKLHISGQDALITNFRTITSSFCPGSDPGEPSSMMRVMASCNGAEYPVTFTLDPFFRTPEVRAWKDKAETKTPFVHYLDDSLPEMGRSDTRSHVARYEGTRHRT